MALTFLNRNFIFPFFLLLIHSNSCLLVYININNFSFILSLAPGSSRAIISYEKLSKSKSSEESNGSAILVEQAPTAIKSTKGHIIFFFFPLCILIKDALQFSSFYEFIDVFFFSFDFFHGWIASNNRQISIAF